MNFVITLVLSSALHAATGAIITVGTVFNVPDGDTICIRTQDNLVKKVRLHGIDTPENDQPDGNWAGQILREFTLDQVVTVTSGSEDQYGRLLGAAEIKFTNTVGDECATDQANRNKIQLNEYMLCKGAAWYYKRYESSYSSENRQRWTLALAKAQSKKIGLWKDSLSKPTPPWNWRQDHEPVPVPCE